MVRTFKKCVTLFLAVIMAIGFMPPLMASASSTSVLANIGAREIFEFRNLGDTALRLTFEGHNNTYIDFSRYNRDGGMHGHDRSRGARATSHGVELPGGGMVVIEHRTGSSFSVRGDANRVQTVQLQSPALFVRSMTFGVTETFTNNGTGQRSLSWVTSGYPVYNSGVPNNPTSWLTRHTIRPDGSTTAPLYMNISHSNVMVAVGESIVLRGNVCTRTPGWQRDASGSFTAFSGQGYRLTMDGQRSYPPGSTPSNTPAQTTTPPPRVGNSPRHEIDHRFSNVRLFLSQSPVRQQNMQYHGHMREVTVVNAGTSLYAETNHIWHYMTGDVGNWEDWVGLDVWQGVEQNYLSWTVLSNNSYRVTFNTPGFYRICARKDGSILFYAVGTQAQPTPTPPPVQPTPTPPPTNQATRPGFTLPPSSIDNGVWMEFNTTPGNRFGYRIFRATSATGAGVSISDFPIMVNPAHSLQRIITFDANVRPNRDYWFYVREVLEEARFDTATTTLIPEVLGPASARVHVRTSPDITESVAERGFIMMFIGNPYMNVNNVWEGIDPPGNVTVPVITAGRTMVPIRAIIEAMGGTADWHGGERRADLASHGNHVQMWLGRRDVRVNGATNEMDIAPQIVNNRTLIPLRFVAEFLGAQIEWIGSQQMIVIVYELQ